jgi:hypothetical protein
MTLHHQLANTSCVRALAYILEPLEPHLNTKGLDWNQDWNQDWNLNWNHTPITPFTFLSFPRIVPFESQRA